MLTVSCCANQLTGFYMRATLALNGLRRMITSKSRNKETLLSFSFPFLFFKVVRLWTQELYLFFWHEHSFIDGTPTPTPPPSKRGGGSDVNLINKSDVTLMAMFIFIYIYIYIYMYIYMSVSVSWPLCVLSVFFCMAVCGIQSEY